jgi:hypothetical protein
MPIPYKDRPYVYRDHRIYLRRRRAEITIQKGNLPGIIGNQTYLSSEEEMELVKQILNWKDPLSYPTIGDIPDLVCCFMFCYVLFSFSLLYTRPYLFAEKDQVMCP